MAHSDTTNEEAGSGPYSLFGTTNRIGKAEDIISLEEADDGSVETGYEEQSRYDTVDPLSRYDNVEVRPRPSGGFFSLFSSKKLVEKEDLISVEEAGDSASVKAGIETDRMKYNVNDLRVPSILDQAEGNVEEEEGDILDDPYSEIGPLKEPMMTDEEEDVHEDEGDEKKRFMMGLTSKVFFLLGSMLFLMLAVHDFQRIKASQPPTHLEQAKALKEQANAQDVPTQTQTANAPTESMDDDVDPFVVTSINNTNAGDLEEEMAMAEAQKEERTGGAVLVWNTEGTGTRRRAQTTQTNWYTQYWDDLPGDIKDAAGLLGYDQGFWDAGKSVYTDRLRWDKLTPKQQEAASKVFGYTKTTWNDYVDRFLDTLVDSPAPSPSPTAKPTNKATNKPTATPTKDSGSGQDFVGGSGENTEGDQGDESAAGSSGVDQSTQSNEGDNDEASGLEGDVTEGDTNGGSDTNEESMGGAGASTHQTHETEGGAEDGETGEGGVAGDQGSGGIKGTQVGIDGDGDAEDGDGDEDNAVSAFTVNIAGEYPSQPRGRTFMIFYLCAAACFVIVGILDALHQQLGFHSVMVLAGVSGLMAGAFSAKNDTAFNICHSISSHLFLLQAVLLICSRLLLTYDTSVRRVLNLADGLFTAGALMNVVISYMQYDETTPAMTKTSLSASVFWCVAAIIYVTVTIMFWLRRKQTGRTGTTSGEVSMPDSCNVVENGGGGCEISLADDAERRK